MVSFDSGLSSTFFLVSLTNLIYWKIPLRWKYNERSFPPWMPYTINGTTLKLLYLLSDGIFLSNSLFVKFFSGGLTRKKTQIVFCSTRICEKGCGESIQSPLLSMVYPRATISPSQRSRSRKYCTGMHHTAHHDR